MLTGEPHLSYQCYDRGFDSYCASISAHILEGPICEAVLGELGTPDMADEVLDQLTSEYAQAGEKRLPIGGK